MHPGTVEELMMVFNSEGMQRIRRKLLLQDFDDIPCRVCRERMNFTGKTIPEASHFDKVRAAIAAGKTVLDYIPPQLSYVTSEQCNLRCIMCTQSRNERPLNVKPYPVEKVQSLFDELRDPMPYLVALAGGESMFTPDGIALLDIFTGQKYHDTIVQLITNGTLILKNIDGLLGIKKLDIYCSVEGGPNYYEAIRVGGSWNTLYQGLRTFAQRKNSSQHLGISSLLMRTSLSGLPELLEAVLPLADTFSVLQLEGQFLLENIYTYPSLLTDSCYHEQFRKAMDLASSFGSQSSTNISTAAQLEEHYCIIKRNDEAPTEQILNQEIDRLEMLLTGDVYPWMLGGRHHTTCIAARDMERMTLQCLDWLERHLGVLPALRPCLVGHFASITDWISPLQTWKSIVKHIRDKRVGAYGASGGLHNSVLPILHEHGVALTAVFDADAAKWGDTIDGTVIASPDTLQELPLDVIIATSSYHSEIFHVVCQKTNAALLFIRPNLVCSYASPFMANIQELLSQLRQNVTNRVERGISQATQSCQCQ